MQPMVAQEPPPTSAELPLPRARHDPGTAAGREGTGTGTGSGSRSRLGSGSGSGSGLGSGSWSPRCGPAVAGGPKAPATPRVPSQGPPALSEHHTAYGAALGMVRCQPHQESEAPVEASCGQCLRTRPVPSTVMFRQTPECLKLILTHPRGRTDTAQQSLGGVLPDLRNTTCSDPVTHQSPPSCWHIHTAWQWAPCCSHARPVGLSLQTHPASHYCPSQGPQHQAQIHLSSVSPALCSLVQLN